uniref:Uncharacterized protein n=1 Tax=Noctiluca scintillans TaxID=2966 RepID=A0A7S1F434_NOCSC|mmetsp:Transcript_31023/g.82456  ORF Transcript_31023/g.82456 Transcript_31023/m.82456 type:complete len:218 (+) Transcript_31023:69-722(+)
MMCVCAPLCRDPRRVNTEFFFSGDDVDKPCGHIRPVETPEEANARQRCSERKLREDGERQQAAQRRESRRSEARLKEGLRLEMLAARRSEEAKVHAERVLEMERVEKDHEEKREEEEKRSVTNMEYLAVFLEKHGFAGVNNKKTDLRGWRYPLHVAVGERDVSAVRLLLKAGAQTSVKSTSGSTPLELARKPSTRGKPDGEDIVALLDAAVATGTLN